jgi:hypothetical protein
MEVGAIMPKDVREANGLGRVLERRFSSHEDTKAQGNDSSREPALRCASSGLM